LQIYHDGNNSYISDQGTGNLNILSSQIALNNPANTENMLVATADGAVTLYYDNAAKIATSATGVTVTGTVAATAYTGDGSGLTGVGALQLTVLLGLILGVDPLILQIIQLMIPHQGVYQLGKRQLEPAIPAVSYLGYIAAVCSFWDLEMYGPCGS
jgi:hypothetical protein